jgi:prepilin-type N-terminal cleavage/methylation domain-containing protein
MDNAVVKREYAGLSHEYGTKNVGGRGNGFTLLEIIIVITLIVLIFGLTTLFFGNALPGARLNSTARELSAMMRYAKMLAQNNGEPQTVLINLDTGRYGIEGVQTRNIPEGINIRVTDPVVLFHESGIVEGGTIALWNTKRTINIELDPIVGSVVLK